MKKLVSLLIICASVVGATVSAFAYSDTDNSSDKSSIDELSQLGIINGFEDGTFKPQENVTRAQAAKMCIRDSSGYTGTEKWAIVTELAEEELWVNYPDVIRRCTPFILLYMARGEVIDES